MAGMIDTLMNTTCECHETSCPVTGVVSILNGIDNVESKVVKSVAATADVAY